MKQYLREKIHVILKIVFVDHIFTLSRALESFKSSLACPKPIVDALKCQTGLPQATIQAKYVNFKMHNPTGFLGK